MRFKILMCYIYVYGEMYRRTSIVLDDKVVSETFKYSKAKTKKELIHEALIIYSIPPIVF